MPARNIAREPATPCGQAIRTWIRIRKMWIQPPSLRMERISPAKHNRVLRIGLCALQQHVPLLAQRQLDGTVLYQVCGRQRLLVVGDDGVVDAQAAALDLAPRFAVRGDKAGPDEGGDDAEACQFRLWNFHRRKVA